MREQINTIERVRPIEAFFDLSEDFEISSVMHESLEAAISISSLNKALVRNGSNPESFLPIDVMSSTNQKFDSLERYGSDSLEFAMASDMQREDVNRLVDEVFNAKTFRLREPLFQDFDYELKEYFSLGKSHNEMVRKGLSPYCNPEETKIRQIEFVEEQICSNLQERLENTGVNLISIKECPDWSIEAYKNGESNTGGYVPSENKFVVQIFKFVNGGRIYQQASIPGNLIDHQDILDTLSNLSGKEVGGDKMDIRSKFFLSEMDIVDIVKMLDETASLRTGEKIFLGMKSDANSSYEKISEITNIDKDSQEIIADQIITKLDQMHEDNINPIICANNLDKFVTNLIIDKHSGDEKVIQGVFGAKFVNMSKKELIQVENASVEYCGAGSCGIQRTEQSSTQAYNAKKSGLKGEIGYFPEGLCSVCKNVGFYVGDNGKYCDNCKSKDLIS